MEKNEYGVLMENPLTEFKGAFHRIKLSINYKTEDFSQEVVAEAVWILMNQSCDLFNI